MNEEVFWESIALMRLADEDVAPQSDRAAEAAIEPLVESLAVRPDVEIQQFADLLRQKLDAIKTEAHRRRYAGPSDDGFEYARCWVVARGRRFYDRVLADPEAMPEDSFWTLEAPPDTIEELRAIPSPTLEPLLYAAAYAYERKTGQSGRGGSSRGPRSECLR